MSLRSHFALACSACRALRRLRPGALATQPEEPSKLPPARMSADSVVLEVAFVRLPASRSRRLRRDLGPGRRAAFPSRAAPRAGRQWPAGRRARAAIAGGTADVARCGAERAGGPQRRRRNERRGSEPRPAPDAVPQRPAGKDSRFEDVPLARAARCTRMARSAGISSPRRSASSPSRLIRRGTAA